MIVWRYLRDCFREVARDYGWPYLVGFITGGGFVYVCCLLIY